MRLRQVSTEQKVQNNKLLSLIKAAIDKNDGWIGFDHYMQMALYTPGLGYYSGGLAKFGAAGDFITAPELGGLFGASLATQVAEVLAQLESASLLEFGAGSGALAACMLGQLEELDQLPEEYLIVELSSELRDRQRKTLKSRVGHLFSRVKWLDHLPSGFRGVVIANEVLDAMPVKVFEQDAAGEVFELGVSIIPQPEPGKSLFYWQARGAEADLTAAVKALKIESKAQPYRSELGMQAAAWLHSIGEVVEQGVVLLIDYGFREAEYYHPDRDQGTLMCHFQHHAHDDPFIHPGLQDITAHIDFTAIANAGLEAGFEPVGYATQGAFLLSTGLLQHISPEASVRQQLELAQEIKKLTLPHEMGELFKVLALSKNLSMDLCGFRQQNHLHRL